MRRDRDKRDRTGDFGDDRDDHIPSSAPDNDSGTPAEMQLRALWLLDEIIRIHSAQ